MEGLREPYRLLFRNLKQSEEALRESESRYRSLSENLERAVEKKVAELRQAQSLAALGQMVSVVAHEIRNPLQSISMGLDALRAGMRDDKNKLEILAEIEHGVTVLNSTVKELLEYSRPVNVEYQPWSIPELVRQALNMLGEKFRNITVSVETQDGGATISVDGPKLMRVLMNLLSNAADAMPNGGNLRICAEVCEGDGLLKIYVSDTGAGIDEATLERIQEPFFTTKTHGTGLGIPICKKIVEAHNGQLTIRSKVNEGTTIEITLPIAHA